jgi:hypothetical protein
MTALTRHFLGKCALVFTPLHPGLVGCPPPYRHARPRLTYTLTAPISQLFCLAGPSCRSVTSFQAYYVLKGVVKPVPTMPVINSPSGAFSPQNMTLKVTGFTNITPANANGKQPRPM